MNDNDQNPEESFWQPTAEIHDPPALPAETASALERLGPTPFAKSGFPFLGFLATVYDHVASHCQPERAPQQPHNQQSENRD